MRTRYDKEAVAAALAIRQAARTPVEDRLNLARTLLLESAALLDSSATREAYAACQVAMDSIDHALEEIP